MSKMIDRTLTPQQWEKLRYPINLRALSEEEGGGWFVTIPLLGEATCAADGETVEEALANLEELRRSLYEAVIASKHPIPLPSAVTEKEAKPTGKWAMRASSPLHAALQKGAAEAGVSFNTYCIECLTRGLDAQAAKNAVVEGIAELKADLICEVSEKLRREARDEMRFAAQNVAEELSYERARTAFLEAEIEVEPMTTSKGFSPPRTFRENVDSELRIAA